MLSSATESTGSESEIPFDPFFLRAAKAALFVCLAEEKGMLNEDAQATIDALAAVNPCLPNPSADVELCALPANAPPRNGEPSLA